MKITKRILLLCLPLLLLACGGDEQAEDTHNPANIIINAKVINGVVTVTLQNSRKKNINDPSIDIRLNGESLAFNFNEADQKAYYTGELGFGQEAVFALAMDNREYLVKRTVMPQKLDESHVRINRLPSEDLEISWDHLGKYNKVKIFKTVLITPYPVFDEELEFTQAPDHKEYDVRIGRGEQLLKPDWLQVTEGRLYGLLLVIEANHSEQVSEVFHKDSRINIRYEYEQQVELDTLF